MPNRSAPEKLWMVILNAGGLGCLFAWFGYIAAFEHFDATRPIKPDSAKGAVIPQNNHGHIAYLTEKDREQLLALQTISIGLALVATLATYFYKNEDRKITEFNGKPVHKQEEMAVIR